MKWKASVFLLLIIVLWSVFRDRPAISSEPLEVMREDLVLRNGRLYLGDAVEPFSGSMVEYYDNEVLKSRTSVIDGQLEGLSEGWHPNGQLQVREHFKANVSHGLRLKWSENGTKVSESNIENGEHHGLFRRWHENGQLAESVNLVRGKADGLSFSYYPSGYLQASVKIEMGEVVEQQFWEDGEMQADTTEDPL